MTKLFTNEQILFFHFQPVGTTNSICFSIRPLFACVVYNTLCKSKLLPMCILIPLPASILLACSSIYMSCKCVRKLVAHPSVFSISSFYFCTDSLQNRRLDALGHRNDFIFYRSKKYFFRKQ